MIIFKPDQLCVIAALFARSNIGMKLPSVEEVQSAFEIPNVNLPTAMEHFCGSYIESHEHYVAFLEEAESWLKNDRIRTLEYIRAIWPKVGALLEEALQ